MSFIKKFIEAEIVSRWNFLLATSCGVFTVAAARMFGPSPVEAASHAKRAVDLPYRNRTNPYRNEIVSGGKAFTDAQPADWDTQKANQIMSLMITRLRDEITDVHCANDTIGYGVFEALRAEGVDNSIVTCEGNPQAVGLVHKEKIFETVFTIPIGAAWAVWSTRRAARRS